MTISTTFNQQLFRLVAFGIITLTALAYLCVIIFYAENIPAYDDYVDALPFIIGLSANPDFSQTIGLIFEQYNQHFIITNRLVYAAIYLLTGEINFYIITLLANINIFLLAVLYSRLATGPNRLYLLLTCCALLFQLSYYRTSLWPMTSMQHFSTLVLALLAISLLESKSKFVFLLAMVITFLATFSSGSGQLILFAGFLKLIIDFRYHQAHDKYKLIYWVAFSIITLTAFYTIYDATPLLDPELPQPINPVDNFPRIILSFLALVGSPFAFDNTHIAITLGIIFITLYVIFLFKGYRNNSTLIAYSFLLLATMGILAGTRYWVGIDSFIAAQRYQFYAINFLITLIFLSCSYKNQHLNNQPGSKTYLTITVLAFVFCISTYAQELKAVQAYRKDSIDGMVRWVEQGKTGRLRRPVFVDLSGPWRDLKTLYDKKIYNPDLSDYIQSSDREH